mmetsp:Transcript_6135/g.9814  ORF Transcript_6135/g.9814 Transcript_6135/m.9814 type:complete len:159 (+) Transcript_6135:267-743(+)
MHQKQLKPEVEINFYAKQTSIWDLWPRAFCSTRQIPRCLATKKKSSRHSLVFGTLDGGVGSFVPVDERVFRRLYALQGVMVNAIQHNAGLNPRAFRLFVPRGFHSGRKKNVINGSLVWQFVSLDSRFQHRLASAIGTTVSMIFSNLLEIEMSTPMGFY